MNALDWFVRRTGTGGSQEPFEVVTDGKTRFQFRGTHPAIEGRPALTTPDASTMLGSGVLFFRNDGNGKSQLCVRFPSGAVQILATEP